MRRATHTTREERVMYQEIGARLRVMREERGWSQITLCHHAGFNAQSKLVLLENGRSTLSVHDLVRFAGAFQIDPSVLLKRLLDGEQTVSPVRDS